MSESFTNRFEQKEIPTIMIDGVTSYFDSVLVDDDFLKESEQISIVTIKFTAKYADDMVEVVKVSFTPERALECLEDLLSKKNENIIYDPSPTITYYVPSGTFDDYNQSISKLIRPKFFFTEIGFDMLALQIAKLNDIITPKIITPEAISVSDFQRYGTAI